MNAPKAQYQIIYNGKNITADILPYVLSFSYSDKSQGEADEIEILLEDSERLWLFDWYPVKGDTISAKIIDTQSQVLDCGKFTVDEITGEGSIDGDTFAIKGLAAGIDKSTRSKESFAHENKTLREIANTIAAKHGFTVQGNIDNIRIARVSQYRETDLKFLRRLSFEYGYSFSVRDNKLIFTNIFELESKASALSIHRSEISSYSITDKTSETFKGAKITYHNPRQKKVITHDQQEKNEAYQGAKNDTKVIYIKAENKQQAELKSRVALYRANSLQQEGTIEMPGNVFAVAGNNCELQGLGMLSGLYYLNESTHTIDKESSYKTTLGVKRVGLVNKEKQKSRKKI